VSAARRDTGANGPPDVEESGAGRALDVDDLVPPEARAAEVPGAEREARAGEQDERARVGEPATSRIVSAPHRISKPPPRAACQAASRTPRRVFLERRRSEPPARAKRCRRARLTAPHVGARRACATRRGTQARGRFLPKETSDARSQVPRSAHALCRAPRRSRSCGLRRERALLSGGSLRAARASGAARVARARARDRTPAAPRSGARA